MYCAQCPSVSRFSGLILFSSLKRRGESSTYWHWCKGWGRSWSGSPLLSGGLTCEMSCQCQLSRKWRPEYPVRWLRGNSNVSNRSRQPVNKFLTESVVSDRMCCRQRPELAGWAVQAVPATARLATPTLPPPPTAHSLSPHSDLAQLTLSRPQSCPLVQPQFWATQDTISRCGPCGLH